jgi:hypothetical protein
MLVSLAMTACAIFIPTSADAISLTFTPIDTVLRNPGESIRFKVIFDPGPSASVIRPRAKYFLADWDNNELEYQSSTYYYDSFIVVTEPKIIADVTFSVLPGVIGDTRNDYYNVAVLYTTEDANGRQGPDQFVVSSNTVDVAPVPEPLTIFGSGMGLGLGVLFKKNVQGNRKKAKSF